MLRIGYDAYPLFNNFTGPGNYSRTLIKQLTDFHPEAAYFLYSSEVTRNEETRFFLNSAMVNVQTPRHRPAFLWRFYGLQRHLRRHRIQLFHGLDGRLPLRLPRRLPGVVTVHDMAFRRYPEFYSPLERRLWDFQLSRACRRADRIVAISEHTKQDVIEFYGINPGDIRVVYQSVNERYMVEKAPKALRRAVKRYELPEQYLLYVGAVSLRKNLLAAVQALALLPPDERLPFVIIGQGDGYRREVLEYARRHQLEDLLLFRQPDFDDMPAVYQKAVAFVYPSLYEGFGIPVLEALFSRIPVITSDRSSLPEAGGDAALLIDPTDPEALAAAIRRVLQDEELREQMIERGFRHAQKFRGEGLAGQMFDLYRELIE